MRDRGLPDRREFEYRIKSASEEHERVVLESELSIAVTVPSRPVPWPLVHLTCADYGNPTAYQIGGKKPWPAVGVYPHQSAVFFLT